MNRIKNLPRWIIFAVIGALLFSPTLPGRAQEQKTVTGTGTLGPIPADYPLTMTFPPGGGDVNGSLVFRWNSSDSGGCPGSITITFLGSFAGGDGDAAAGTWLSTAIKEAAEGCEPDTMETNGIWDGNFYANGTGNGIFYGVDGSKTPWQVTYSAEEFQAALKPPVTKDYILTTYGLKLEGSYEKDWSQHELELLNDVLKEIPADLWKKMALTSIIRSDVKIDENMKLKPDDFGDYSPCGDLMGNNDCSGSSANIRIFDRATSPYDFTDDPNGDTEFKATILHEMIHAMQYQKDASSTYANPYTSPLVRDYMEATRPGIGKYYVDGWTCCGNKTNGWELDLNGTTGNEPPTAYGKTNPLEDMTESAMMYVYDPQRLKNSSQKRYDFIKKNIFGDIEYDNGQKKP